MSKVFNQKGLMPQSKSANGRISRDGNKSMDADSSRKERPRPSGREHRRNLQLNKMQQKGNEEDDYFFSCVQRAKENRKSINKITITEGFFLFYLNYLYY